MTPREANGTDGSETTQVQAGHIRPDGRGNRYTSTNKPVSAPAGGDVAGETRHGRRSGGKRSYHRGGYRLAQRLIASVPWLRVSGVRPGRLAGQLQRFAEAGWSHHHLVTAMDALMVQHGKSTPSSDAIRTSPWGLLAWFTKRLDPIQDKPMHPRRVRTEGDRKAEQHLRRVEQDRARRETGTSPEMLARVDASIAQMRRAKRERNAERTRQQVREQEANKARLDAMLNGLASRKTAPVVDPWGDADGVDPWDQVESPIVSSDAPGVEWPEVAPVGGIVDTSSAVPGHGGAPATRDEYVAELHRQQQERFERNPNIRWHGPGGVPEPRSERERQVQAEEQERQRREREEHDAEVEEQRRRDREEVRRMREREKREMFERRARLEEARRNAVTHPDYR